MRNLARCAVIFAFAAFGLGSIGATAQTTRPNIVLILVDDAALMDFGAYGGEAQTPNIDALASRGVIFTQYRTSPMCAPSRAMLLTGRDSHVAGIANLPEFLPKRYRSIPGYRGHLEPGVTTLATHLQTAGYRTFMTGKWHLGHGEGELPNAHGFDRSFALDASGADNWRHKAYLPIYPADLWFEDGIKAIRPDGIYSSEFLVDKLIEYINEDTGESSPFFAYLAFQAIHIPVQAPAGYAEKYQTVYSEGWDTLRQSRWEKAQTLGLVPENAPLAPMLPKMKRFEKLSADKRELAVNSMALNAAMLEAMDEQIGRLVSHIDSRGQLSHTVFVITSDNGPASSDPLGDRMTRGWIKRAGYEISADALDQDNAYAAIGPEWANAAASPSNFFKFYAGDGGLRVPLIVSGGGLKATRKTDARSFVTDIAPTLMAMAGVDPDPGMTGRNLVPVLSGASSTVYAPDEPVAIEAAGHAAVLKGDLKLVRNMPPLGDGTWHLYDISSDPGETINLAETRPDEFEALREDYEAYALKVGVMEMPKGYQTHRQLVRNLIAQRLAKWGWVLILLGMAAVIGLAWLGRWAWRRYH